MFVSNRFLLPLISCAVMIVSCGRGNDDVNNSAPAVIAPQNEISNTSKFTSIVLEENCGFWTDCDFTIRADLNQRPVIVAANFIDDGWPSEEDDIDEGACDFQITLSDAVASKLEAYADKLRFCSTENTPTAERGFDGLFSTDIKGEHSMVYKYKDGAQDEDGKISYICAGRDGYYNYMRKIIVSEAPADCPSGYKRLFN